MSTAERDAALRDKIMLLLDVTRWSARCKRAYNYFQENPEEKRHIDEYRVHYSSDGVFLQRNPDGIPTLHRVGTIIGTRIFRDGTKAHVYLFRVAGRLPHWRPYQILREGAPRSKGDGKKHTRRVAELVGGDAGTGETGDQHAPAGRGWVIIVNEAHKKYQEYEALNVKLPGGGKLPPPGEYYVAPGGKVYAAKDWVRQRRTGRLIAHYGLRHPGWVTPLETASFTPEDTAVRVLALLATKRPEYWLLALKLMENSGKTE